MQKLMMNSKNSMLRFAKVDELSSLFGFQMKIRMKKQILAIVNVNIAVLFLLNLSITNRHKM